MTETAVAVVAPAVGSALGVSPQEYAAPALTAEKHNPPATGTGLTRVVLVPSPSWPLLLYPQIAASTGEAIAAPAVALVAAL